MRTAARRSENTWVLLLVLMSMGAWMLNPYGPYILQYTWEVARNADSLRYIEEWRSVSLSTASGRHFIGVAVALGVLFALPAVRRLPVWSWALYAAFTGLALTGERYVVWWPLALAPAVTRQLYLIHALKDHPFWADVRLFLYGRKIINMHQKYDLQADCQLAGCRWPGVALALLVVVVFVGTRQLVTGGTAPLAPEVPTGIAEYLSEHVVGHRIVAPYKWAGYLEWETWPKYRYLVDSRNQLLAEGVLEDYLAIYALRPDASALLRRYGADALIVSAQLAPQALRRLGSEWKQVYRDNRGAVLVRESSVEKASSKE